MPIPPILVYAAVGFFLLFFKAIALPVGWFEVYFHELSHGIAAVITGGRVHALELNFDTSGSLTHSGSRFTILVSFAGYAGATLWGLLIYKTFSPLDKTTKTLTLALMILIAASTLFWIRDLQSLAVAFCLLAILAACWQLLSDRLASHVMGLIGASLIVSSSQSAWSLFGIAADKGDASALAKKTLLIPSFVWILSWVLISFLCLMWIYRRERAQNAMFRL